MSQNSLAEISRLAKNDSVNNCDKWMDRKAANIRTRFLRGLPQIRWNNAHARSQQVNEQIAAREIWPNIWIWRGRKTNRKRWQRCGGEALQQSVREFVYYRIGWQKNGKCLFSTSAHTASNTLVANAFACIFLPCCTLHNRRLRSNIY